MANLETLTLEINGSAASASQGINQLIGSLSALGAELDKHVGSARAFASALQNIHSSAMTGNGTKSALSSLSSPATAKGIKQTTKAITELSKEEQNARTVAKYGYLPILNTPGAEEVARQVLPQNKTKEATASMKEYSKAVESTAKATDKAAKGTNELAKAEKEVGRTTSSIRQASHATTSLWKQIGRIAKTMMIRMAIRALLKVAKQGLQNFYQYSKSINSAYATAIDKLGVGATKAGNQLGASIGTLLATVAPILSTIISLVNAAISALTAFFSLLGGGTTYTKAVDGMNAFANAAGGGGSAMKELLADFDEFNIIAQEGGGGGGGGGGFSGIFEQSPIPRWMEEWLPLLKALLFGTIGATILPAIASILGNIISMFTGTGAGNLLQILKYLFTGNIPKFPDIPDYTTTQFPVQPEYKPFPVQPPYSPFPVMPDYAKGAAEMGVFSAAAVAAAPAMTTIVGALTALGSANLLKNGLIALLTKLANATMKVKVNREEFDKFKKEVEEWVKEYDEKKIIVRVNDVEFKIASAVIDAWAGYNAVKKIFTTWYAQEFNICSAIIDSWAKDPAYKRIYTTCNLVEFNLVSSLIDSWANTVAYKWIYTLWNAGEFNIGATTIDAWASKPAYKYIYTLWYAHEFNIGVAIIDAWASATTFKLVKVGFDSTAFVNFWKIADAIDEWAKQTLTKVINVVVRQTTDNSSGTKKAVTNALGNGVSATLGGTLSSGEQGLGFKLESSFLAGDGGLTWNGETIFGNGGIVEKWINNLFKADGAYGIPSGDLFIANEAGAELVGSINGKTSVANQGQIIEGIQKGVAEANSEQNALLRQQNELLRGILEKETTIRFGASAQFGRTALQSINMYNGMTGG